MNPKDFWTFAEGFPAAVEQAEANKADEGFYRVRHRNDWDSDVYERADTGERIGVPEDRRMRGLVDVRWSDGEVARDVLLVIEPRRAGYNDHGHQTSFVSHQLRIELRVHGEVARIPLENVEIRNLRWTGVE